MHNLETLEARVEELNKNLEDAKKTLATERRKNERLQQDKSGIESTEPAATCLRPTNKLKLLNSNGSESQFEEVSPNCYKILFIVW